MHLEVAVQDLLRVHVLQRAAQLLQPAEHSELGEGRAVGVLLSLLDGALDTAARNNYYYYVVMR